LAFIEAQAIVEQQLDIAADEFLAVVVDRMFQLHLYLLKTVAEDGFLVFAQVQSLSGGIGEEVILLDVMP
jgi:hypothetical protein